MNYNVAKWPSVCWERPTTVVIITSCRTYQPREMCSAIAPSLLPHSWALVHSCLIFPSTNTLQSTSRLYLLINHNDLDFSATACPTDTFAAMSGRGRSSRGRGDRSGYESRGRAGGRGGGDGLGFRGGRGGGRGREVAVEVYSSVFSLMSNQLRLTSPY